MTGVMAKAAKGGAEPIGGVTLRNRLSVIARVVAGTLGAYGLTSLLTVASSLALSRAGMDAAEAVTAATLASFAIFAAISMAVFHARSVLRAWAWLAGVAVPLILVIWMMTSAR